MNSTSVISLAIYGFLPVLRNTIVGLDAVPAATVDAARGVGMSRIGVLARVDDAGDRCPPTVVRTLHHEQLPVPGRGRQPRGGSKHHGRDAAQPQGRVPDVAA